MNITTKIFGIALALAAAVFAADQATPAAPAPEAAALEQSAPEATAAEPAAPAPEAAPATEPAPAEAASAEQPAAEPAPAEPVAEPAEEAAAPAPAMDEEVPAPRAVRGVPADAPAGYPYAEAPKKAPPAPAHRRAEPVPMTFAVGAQAFVGMSNLYDNNWDLNESYDGAEWKAGATVLIPLNEYTMGFRLGVFYSRSETSASYAYSADYTKEAHLKFKQDRIDVPVLFVLKPTYSRFTIDMGAQVSFPVRDVFKYSYEKTDVDPEKNKVNKKHDMIDLEYRAPMDFSLVFGFSVRANKYVSFDVRTDCGFSNLYEGVPGWRINDLTRTAMMLGFSVYAF